MIKAITLIINQMETPNASISKNNTYNTRQ